MNFGDILKSSLSESPPGSEGRGFTQQHMQQVLERVRDIEPVANKASVKRKFWTRSSLPSITAGIAAVMILAGGAAWLHGHGMGTAGTTKPTTTTTGQRVTVLGGPDQVTRGGGLGDKLSVLEKKFGTPVSVTTSHSVQVYQFKDEIRAEVLDGRVIRFERTFRGTEAAHAMQVFSVDDTPLDTSSIIGNPSETGNVQYLVYQSESLAQVFGKSAFQGAVSGTYTVEIQTLADARTIIEVPGDTRTTH